MLDTYHRARRRPGSPPGTRSARNPRRRSSGRRRPLEIEGGTDPANANSVGKPRGQGLDLGDLLLRRPPTTLWLCQGRTPTSNRSRGRRLRPAQDLADLGSRRPPRIAIRTLRDDALAVTQPGGQRRPALQPPPRSTSAPRSTSLASGCTHPVPGPWQPSSQIRTSPAQQCRAWPQPPAAPADLDQEAARPAAAPPSSRVAVMASSVGRPGLKARPDGFRPHPGSGRARACRSEGQ